jgi:hypothetical protein
VACLHYDHRLESLFYVTFAVFYCFRISEHEYVMSGKNSALYDRYRASRTAEQRGENINDVEDDKSMSY